MGKNYEITLFCTFLYKYFFYFLIDLHVER